MISFRSALITGLLICAFAAQGVAAQTEHDLIGQLRADYKALSDARAEFEQAENNANTSSAEQADYADWIMQLSHQFAQSCRSLAVSSTQRIPADIPCEEYTSAYRGPAGIDVNAETTDAERTAGMVGQFNASLGDFDEKLLREQDRVKARKAQTSSASGGGGGTSGSAEGSAEGADGAEGESGQEGSEAAQGESGESSQSGQQSGQQGSESGSSNNQDNSSAGSPSAGRPSSAPPGTPDGRNDDVIARQLREAAEKETDPELKRKLWEEYRRYKQGK